MQANVRVVGSEFSEFQHIMLTEQDKRTSLVLDGHYQTPLPNNNYYDILLAPNMRNEDVSILGGGDMTCLPVLHRRGIVNWRMFEIDRRVVEVCLPLIPNKPKDVLKHIDFGDAIEALRDGRANAPHIIVDLLGINRLDALAACEPEEFIDLLCAAAGSLITGYTAGFTQGIMLNELMKFQFHKRGFQYFTTVYNDVEECFFYASKTPIAIPPRIGSMIVGYRVFPKNSAIADYCLREQIQIVREAF